MKTTKTMRATSATVENRRFISCRSMTVTPASTGLTAVTLSYSVLRNCRVFGQRKCFEHVKYCHERTSPIGKSTTFSVVYLAQNEANYKDLLFNQMVQQTSWQAIDFFTHYRPILHRLATIHNVANRRTERSKYAARYMSAKVITTMVDDRIYCVRSAFTHLWLCRKLCDWWMVG